MYFARYLSIGAALVFAGCAAHEESGTVQLALTGTSPSGNTYRLRDAQLTINGGAEPIVFHTEDAPDRTLISQHLAAGDYTLHVTPGWRLERVRSGGTVDTVQATLTSPDPQPFTITTGAASAVALRFVTDGEVVSTDGGDVGISISVDDGACDPAGMFDAPVLLPGLSTAAGSEGAPRLTSDELELYFNAIPGGATAADIYRAVRASTGESFGAPSAVIPLNTPQPELPPSLTGDGLTVVFSRVPSNEGRHIFLSTRASRSAEFGAPAELANVNSATVTVNDSSPFITADGQELWFTSDRAGGVGSNDIFRATRNNASSAFGNPIAVPELNTSADEALPALSADHLTIYFSSMRAGGAGSYDIWTAHRNSTSAAFSTPTRVPELSSAAGDLVGWLSPDNCRLYFSSDRAGTFDIYVATRHPK